jgi:hypothetical protein
MDRYGDEQSTILRRLRELSFDVHWNDRGPRVGFRHLAGRSGVVYAGAVLDR